MSNSSSVSQKELEKRNFILTGNIWKVVFTISFPLFLYALFQYLYSFVDVILASRMKDNAALDAVSIITQISAMVQSIGDGIAAGGSILIAREIGKYNYKKAHTLSNSIFLLVFIVAFLLCAIFIPLAKPIMFASGASEEIVDVGFNYFAINIANSALVIINSVFIATQKAKGSTKIISIFNIMIICIKIGLSFLFVYGFSLEDITFIALATFIANFTMFIIMIFGFLIRKSYIFHFSIKDIDLSYKANKKLTIISFPIFLGKFIFSLGKNIINSMVGTHFPNQGVVGALGVSNSIGGMATKGLSAIEDSSSSIISQNLGNKNTDRALKTFYVGLVYNLIIGGLGVLIVSIFNEQITNFYSTDLNTGVIDYQKAKMISDIFFYEKMGIITLAINSSVLGLLYGFGYTRLSMVINLMRVFVFRVPSLYFMLNILPNLGVKIEPSYLPVGISMGFSNIMIGIVALIVAIIVIFKIKKQEKHKKEVEKMLDAKQKEKVEKFIKNYLNNYDFYKKSKNIHWCYEDGVIVNGALQLYKASKDKFYLDFVKSHFDKCISEDGIIDTYSPEERNIDNVEEGFALFELNQIEHKEKYQKALKSLEYQLRIMPRTKSGSFWHKDIYPYQIWLDGLYMGMPFYTLVACKDHSIREIKDILNQFKNVEKYNYDPQTNSFMHCYDETKTMQWANKTTGRSPNVWLRSVGWLGMASCDVYEILKNNGTAYALLGKDLKSFLEKVLNSLKGHEDEKTHLYYDLVNLKDVKGNYIETSGSLMIAYSYIKGSRLKMIKADKQIIGIKMLASIIDNFLTEDELKNVCRVSGLDNKKRDGSVQYYLSEEVCSNDTKAVGPLMMAYSEYIKISK